VKIPDEGCVGPAGDIVNVLGLVADTFTEPPLTVGQVVANTIAGLNELPILKFNVTIESHPLAAV
jgi:hypothetical protein